MTRPAIPAVKVGLATWRTWQKRIETLAVVGSKRVMRRGSRIRATSPRAIAWTSQLWLRVFKGPLDKVFRLSSIFKRHTSKLRVELNCFLEWIKRGMVTFFLPNSRSGHSKIFFRQQIYPNPNKVKKGKPHLAEKLSPTVCPQKTTFCAILSRLTLSSLLSISLHDLGQESSCYALIPSVINYSSNKMVNFGKIPL